jgi:hypothetical protein
MGDNDLFVLLNTLRPDIIIDKASYEAITEPNAHINRPLSAHARVALAGPKKRVKP